MNKLSWLIYWADTIPHLASWLCIVSFVLFAIFAGCFAYGVTDLFGEAVKISHTYNHKTGDYDRVETVASASFKQARRLQRLGYLAPLFFVLWGASFMVPEKNTFYMIAASEAGEQAMQTPEFIKVRKVIDNWLDENSGDSADKKTDDNKKG